MINISSDKQIYGYSKAQDVGKGEVRRFEVIISDVRYYFVG